MNTAGYQYVKKMNKISIYDEIRHCINSGAIASLPKERLEQFLTALARSQAYTHFSSSEFPRVCEAVKTFLAHRLSDDVADKYSRKKNNDQWWNKPLGITFLAAMRTMLAAGIIYLIAKYFGVQL